ncbi:hypothetical protein [Mycobacterium palustre]|uniref:hypothetical protein n=1 Tax=Mycobacterium palustre TaxID=153971 RepID=UPI001302953D|nr:hypothetical protein [Mycobacterium palustre]MCV7103528.1 hypothetical protein [Mycobacterium palustre]
MSHLLPPELLNRCATIDQPDAQGVALTKADYAWFWVATVAVPIMLVILGVLL